MTPNRAFWADKKVLITGHTGFKGAWLSLWLIEMGAEVKGYALEPESEHDLFCALGLDHSMESVFAPVEDAERLAREIKDFGPDFVFHMAAQSLVRPSYSDPLGTLATNVMGTANVLNALRDDERGGVAVIVTSDKCYENAETGSHFKEDDPMGGSDPYSMSKGAAELVVRSFRKSYFQEAPWCVASVRSGNVFGGGDWAKDRIIPDYFRAMGAGEALIVRRPSAVRPWLYVLDTLTGYLMLAERCFKQKAGGERFDEGWNFGPDASAIKTVSELIDAFHAQLNDAPEAIIRSEEALKEGALKEAHFLALDSQKARGRLGWRPRLDFSQSAAATAQWYQAYLQGVPMLEVSRQHLAAYSALPLAASPQDERS